MDLRLSWPWEVGEQEQEDRKPQVRLLCLQTNHAGESERCRYEAHLLKCLLFWMLTGVSRTAIPADLPLSTRLMCSTKD